MSYLPRVMAVCILCVHFSGCDVLESDRLTKLTGAKTEIERVYVCQAVYEEEAIKARVLRDSVKSEESKAWAIKNVAEADATNGKLIMRIERYPAAEFKKASIQFNKRFTQAEFTALLGNFDRVLKAHCLELLSELDGEE